MAIISMFSGSFCQGEEVVALVTGRLGYARIDGELLPAAARESGLSTERLARVMHGPPPFLHRLTGGQFRNLAYLRAALAELIGGDDLVFHGFAALLIPTEISHVLRVCLVANLDHRVASAARTEGISAKEASKLITRHDAERARWTQLVAGKEPYAEDLYDVLVPMHATTLEQAAEIVCENAGKEAVRTTPASRQAVADFQLAARVNVALAKAGHDVEVTARGRHVHIAINKYVLRLGQLERKLAEIASGVEGVGSVKCVPGTGYVPPPLVGPQEIKIPTKILLVDDEREFVHTLSERLQSRDLDSEVVYDGEQALAALESEPPDVMVLDLKMPGIDGIEVLRRVKRDHPGVEVIILTGHGSEREEQLARELGAFAYLKKPVDIEVLARTMKEAYRKLGKSGPPARRDGED